MSVCPVCGCKTDELDFVLCTLENNEEMVCSFCEKQIKKLYTDEEPAIAQVRWLNSVVEKEVPTREENILTALKTMQQKFAQDQQEEISAFSVENRLADTKRDVNVPPSFSNGSANITVDQYNNLVKRLEKLEKSFAKYKKAQLMKTVCELLVPVVLAIIIAIVFFASGLYDTLSLFTNSSSLY